MKSKKNSNTKIRLTKWWKAKKEAFFVILFCLIFIALFALLIASTNSNWPESWQITFMISILICSSIAVAHPLFKKERVTIPELIVVGICVLLLLIAVIIFASVATGIYRDPIIQISASFTGGLMTLYGVGLTIKYNRLAKEEDDIIKAKPNIFPIGQQTWKSLIGTEKLERDIEPQPELGNLKAIKDGINAYAFAPIYLANSDLSMCTLKGIIINGKYYIVFRYDVVLPRGSANCFKLDYCFELKEEIDSVELVVGDMLENTYTCLVSFALDSAKKKKAKQINIMGTLETKLLDAKLIDFFC